MALRVGRTFAAITMVAIAVQVAGPTRFEAQAAVSDPTTTFTIGGSDQSDAEFALAPDGYSNYSKTFPQDVDFTVGSSDTKTDWSYVQPGPSDSWAGGKQHPFTVHYTLTADQVADQLLTVHYRDTNANSPVTARIASNGTTAATSQLPAGNGGGVFGTGWAPYDFKAFIPKSTLHEGDNTVTITNVSGAWTIYDSVEMRPSTGEPLKIDSARPTVLFVKDGDAERQLVDLSTTNIGPPQQVTFTAKAGDQTATTTTTVASGVATTRIKVPPTPKGDPVPLTITPSTGDAFSTTLPYQRRWTFHIDHGSHLDIGYTAIQPKIREQQDDILDQAIGACEKTRDYPDDAKFRWGIEGVWVLQNYLKDRGKDQVAKLQSCIDSDQIEVAASYDNNLHDLQSSEQLVRSVYLGAKTYKEKFHHAVDSAYENDSPGVTWQYVQALAKAGVHNLLVGANPTRAPQASKKPSLFWWQAPNGSKLLTWYTGPDVSYAEGYGLFPGGDPMSDFNRSVDSIDRRLETVQQQGYSYDFYLAMMRLDNRPIVGDISDFAQQFDQTYTWPKVVVSSPQRFFSDVEKRHLTDIPTNSGDWSDWWVDGAGSSARETAMNRDAQDRTVAAETLGALSTLTTPSDGTRQAKLDEAYEQGNLYTEHTWGSSALSFDDPEWPYKRAYAENADQLSKQALASGLDDISQRVRNTTPWPAVAAFNTLSFARDGEIEATVAEGRLGSQPFKLLDGSTEVPYAVVKREDGKITLRFVARGVPAVGYKTFTLEPDTDGTTAQTTDPALHVDKTGLENAFYKVTLDPKTGAIASIVDKRTGRQLVDGSSPYKVNQFIYRPNPGGRNNARSTDAEQWTPKDATVKVTESGPDQVSLEVTHDTSPGGAVTGVRSLTERISLSAGTPRVDIANTLDKERVESPEEAYYAFPFKVDKPNVTYEIPGGQARFFTDQLPGSAMDWQTIWRYADVSDGTGGVTLSSPGAPMIEVDRIRTQEFQTRPGRLDGRPDGVNAADYAPKHGWIFSYALNNLWFTNYRVAQEGPVTFRYGITSHAGGFDATKATEFGSAVHTPLYAHSVGPRQAGPYQPGSHSLVSTSAPNVTVQTVKRAADGQPGLTVRLLEVAGTSGTATLRLPFQVGSAQLADSTERPLHPLTADGQTVSVPVEGHGIVTVLVTPRLSLTATADSSTIVRGGSTKVTVLFTNDGPRTLSGNVSLTGPDPVSIEPAARSFTDLAPGAAVKETFDVSVPASAKLGPVQLLASSDVPDVAATALSLDVVNPVDVTAQPAALDLIEGQSSKVTLTLANNLPDSTDVTAKLAVPDGWTGPEPKTVTLASGATTTVSLSLKPPAGSLGTYEVKASAVAGEVTSEVALPTTVSHPVVMVGEVDGSTHEFALAPADYAKYSATFPNDVDFTAGVDDPATKWSYIQPGPRDDWAGAKDHPFTFRFNLPEAPKQDLTFTARLLDTQNAYQPVVRVGLNGADGGPITLPVGGGDGYHWGDGKPNQYGGISPTQFDVTLPAAQLKAGENVVKIDHPSGSWLVYDALGILQKP